MTCKCLVSHMLIFCCMKQCMGVSSHYHVGFVANTFAYQAISSTLYFLFIKDIYAWRVYVFVCAHVCIRVNMPEEEVLLTTLHCICLLPLRQGLSLNLELSWKPVSPSHPHVSTLQGVIGALVPYPAFYTGVGGFELRSSGCTASDF